MTGASHEGGGAGHAASPDLGELRDLAADYLTGCAADPAGWHRLLGAAAANLRHGFVNAVLVDAQQPGAGPVATYEEWKSAGWQVSKGEQAGIRIIGGPAGNHRPAAMFTPAQVRPARAAADPPLPGAARVTSGDPSRVLGALTAFARRRGYAITRPEDAAARPCTDWQQRLIVVPGSLPPARAAAALAHQLGHIMTEGGRAHLAGETTARCHGSAAVEADSAAWLVLARLGLDPAAAAITFPAARIWAAPDPRSPLAGVITAAGKRIVKAAAAIATHTEKVLATIPAPPPAAAPAAPADAAPLRAIPAGEKRAGPAVTVTGRPAWPYPDQDLVRVNAAASAFFRAGLAGSWAAGYLAGRGFGPGICRRWQLGHAPAGWTSLLDHLHHAGYPDALIEAAGLARRSSRGTLIDFFRDRVMIPVRGHHGQVIAFAGRARDGTPKYLNTPQTDSYSKNQVLYGLAESGAALDEGARPVLVEGYFDVIAVTEASRSRFAGVAPGGTALSGHQMAALAGACDLARTPLLVARDQDAGGRKATVRDYEIISTYSRAASTPMLPEGSDPADIFARSGPDGLAGALTAGEHPLADVVVDAVLSQWAGRLQWAEGRLGAMRHAAHVLAKAPPADPVRQIARVAERTGIPHADVAGEFAAEFAAAELPPKGTRSADGGPDRGRRASPVARDFPASPALGRQGRRGQRGAAAVHPATARPPCR